MRNAYRTLSLPGLGLLLALAALIWPAGAFAQDELPDPLDRGEYEVARLDPMLAGLATLHEPASNGGQPTGAASEITLQVRGTLYYPADRDEPSPLLVFVHGNHGSCDSGQAPDCTIFKRNDAGYAYLAENLASWGYVVVSLDQDQMMARQDNPKGKGMHQRRRLIAALLDALYEANEAPLLVDENSNLGSLLVGKLDFTRIGLMGHSRGGDAITSFLDYNRMRPEPGRRYPIRGAISLAPVDYERRAPYGTPYMTILPWCDGDVSNLQGARFYERSQYVKPDDPFPRIQSSQLGANHNWYNTVWFADGQDGPSGNDSACRDTQPNYSRLSGEAYPGAYVIDNSDKLNPEVNTRISGDPERMGDQEKIGLATMASFFRRYVGGEGAFDPYMTGELSAVGEGLQIPESACPTSESGKRMACVERVSTSYFAPPDERLDVIRPESSDPLGLSALGTPLEGEGFSNPYLEDGGVQPLPPTTPGGYDWCNPEPEHFAPGQLNVPGLPTASKPCPLPAPGALGGQQGTRENAPINHSYGRQLALAWDGPAELRTTIPAANADVSGYKALAMGADVNFFDPRNPQRTGTAAEWDPAQTTQDFEIALVDGDGNEGVVSAGDPRYGNALHQTTGSTTARVHVVLDQIRVPLEDFADQGVDLTDVRRLELRFGQNGKPATGSIQLADVRFQEAVEGTDVLVDTTEPDAGPSLGPPPVGPDPAELLEEYDRSPGALELPDVVADPGSSVWTVDDDGEDCPNAQFTSIQDAVDRAAPWDTIVICAGLYLESSTPVNHSYANPVQEGAMNGLTITKPLRIKGAGADVVTIRPAPELGPSLAGTTPLLRDGGGNVVTISRQSLGSTDTNENFVHISGVTIESPDIYAEAGVAFLNAAGRITDSVIGPLRRATNAAQLAQRPHGWGVISVNSLVGAGPGTVERDVTIARSLVTGYQAGGVLFDGARGADDSPAATERSGIKTNGFVIDSVIRGHGPSSLIPQNGVQYNAGARGFVEGSRITGNLFPTDLRRSVGILLTDAATEDGGFHATGNVIAGNGYGLFNADAGSSGVREGAPAEATGNWWGPAGPPIEGPGIPGLGIEGVSGDDGNGEASVIFDPVAESEPEGVPDGLPAPPADAPPTGAIVDPADGTEVEVGEELAAIVRASDDIGVKAVSLAVDGEVVDEAKRAPYVLSWTPQEGDGGRTVELEATITDSAGQTSTSSIEVTVAEEEAEPEEPGAEEPTVELGKLKLNKRQGTARLPITISHPGSLALRGKGVKGVKRAFAKPGAKTLRIAPKGAKKRALKRRGSVKVTITITYSPDEGEAVELTKKVKLVRRR